MVDAIIQLEDVSFFYSPDEEDDETNEIRAVENPGAVAPIFQGLTLDMPKGVISLVGENGIGKTTFLLLCGGRLFPSGGDIQLFGRPTTDFKTADQDPALDRKSVV